MLILIDLKNHNIFQGIFAGIRKTYKVL